MAGTSTKTIVRGVRIPNDLDAKLKELSESEHRSVTNMIVVLLLEAVEARDGGQSHRPARSKSR